MLILRKARMDTLDFNLEKFGFMIGLCLVTLGWTLDMSHQPD